MWIILKLALTAIDRSRTVAIAQEESYQPQRKLSGDLAECHLMTGLGGALHLQAVAVIVVKLLQGFNQQLVDRKRDRASPV